MQQKLHLQTTDTQATGDNNAHPKSPTFGRPRSVFTYASEQVSGWFIKRKYLPGN